jgi:hypothetical protein
MLNELRGSFTANSDHVAAKVIDGELIIIRLSDGTYYSMDNAGARVWALIEAQHPIADVVRIISSWYGAAADRVESDVATLVRELLDEGLIIAASAEANGGPGAVPADLEPYETPTLHIYRDMGNLLALDPPTPGIDDLMFGNG